MTDQLRTCYVCKLEKPLISFVRDDKKAGGRTYRCQACKTAAKKSRRLADFRAMRQVWTEKHRKAHPIQSAARGAVSRAVQAGTLQRQPCEECGRVDSHAHHDDYAFPLEVRWLCPLHHRRWHRENGPGRNGDATASPFFTQDAPSNSRNSETNSTSKVEL